GAWKYSGFRMFVAQSRCAGIGGGFAMEEAMNDTGLRQTVAHRAEILFKDHHQSIYRRTDRLFAGLMLCQWLACVLIAAWVSPRSWAGQYSQVHLHVWAAFLLGG